MSLVTYEELADNAQLATNGLTPQLTYINQDLCRKRGLPWLDALAVYKDTRLPGDGFLPNRPDDWTDADFRSWWRAMVLAIYCTDWSMMLK